MGVRFGRYELLRPLGRGGMAEVFLARYSGPEGFEKRLVIKRVLPQLGGDRRFLRLFFEEARTQVSLSHGNLVSVFDFGRVSNSYFIAMEHVPGGDLGALLSAARERRVTLPPLLVAHLGIELCRGLGYVHRRGFVHRDLAPRNVLLSTEGEVKLSDFGVALAQASDAAPGVRGTLAYMAPEQARGDRPDGRADLFSLGLVLAEALLGRRARVSSDDQTALATARAGTAVTLEDGPLAQVIARATQPAPADRYADADAMLLALEHEAAALGRASLPAARELAARVAEWLPARADSVEAAPGELGPETAATVGEETYFRDRKSGSFVEQVLAEPGPRPRRAAPWLLAAAALVLTTVGVALAARSLHTASHAPAPIAAADRETSQAAPLPTPAPTVAASVPGNPTASAASSVTGATAKSHTPHAPAPAPRRPPETGTLLVHCTPWCVPVVDGQVRGQDGRNHALVLSAGVHQLTARRLDDHLERTVDVRSGQSQTVELTFD